MGQQQSTSEIQCITLSLTLTSGEALPEGSVPCVVGDAALLGGWCQSRAVPLTQVAGGTASFYRLSFFLPGHQDDWSYQFALRSATGETVLEDGGRRVVHAGAPLERAESASASRLDALWPAPLFPRSLSYARMLTLAPQVTAGRSCASRGPLSRASLVFRAAMTLSSTQPQTTRPARALSAANIVRRLDRPLRPTSALRLWVAARSRARNLRRLSKTWCSALAPAAR
jgi:hypothetical protein